MWFLFFVILLAAIILGYWWQHGRKEPVSIVPRGEVQEGVIEAN
jgi:hypothetical protein